MLHVRYDQQSFDFEVEIPPSASEDEVRMIAAQQLDVGVDALDGYIVAKNPDGEFIVHAEPVYG